MSVPCQSACAPWSTVEDIRGCGNCADATLVSDETLERMIAIATDILFARTGYRFPGTCEDVVRPCGRQLRNDGPIRYTDVQPNGWGWTSLDSGCGCNSGRSCGCRRPDEITLGGWPVSSIVSVSVDGLTLDPSTYRVDDWRYLVRLPDPDGSRHGWPCCQTIDLPATEPDTFEVRFRYGVPPPPGLKYAAEVLACELALACSPATEGQCRLPRGIRSQVRQGVATEFLNPLEFIRDGLFGIVEVDWAISQYPAKMHGTTAFVNPDRQRSVRRAGT